MKKEKEKPHLTDKDLVEGLLLISETSKALAMEVMLLPKEKEEGGNQDEKDTSET